MKMITFAVLFLALSVCGGQEPTKVKDQKPDGVKLRSGVVRDSKGKEKAFEFIRGVPFGGGSGDEKHAIFSADVITQYYAPLNDLTMIEIGKVDANKPTESMVRLKAKDGKQQTLTVNLFFYCRSEVERRNCYHPPAVAVLRGFYLYLR